MACDSIDDYRVEIIATENGTMDVSCNKYVDFKNTDSFKFDDFKITENTTYEIQNNQKSIKNDDNIVYSHDGKIVGCSCKCHKTGFFAKLIWKITIFFNKLLRRNQVCPCGIYHY